MPYPNSLHLRSSCGGILYRMPFQVQYKCVNLSTFISDFSPFIHYRYKLSFNTVIFPECMLAFRQETVFFHGDP